MSFVDAVKTVLSKYATFSGRARRSEYWFWSLATIIAGIVAQLLDQALFHPANQVGPLYVVLSLALLLPDLAVGIRRLHDTSHSGWWVLIGLIPIVGGIVLLVFFISDSHGDNQYGPSPKTLDAAPAYS